ncbi:MAG: hypothetical protein F6K22_39260 [Okeania sp. SIO2F4]|uniref:hypothetical protein n=1 Tax=Okeania sp. SIO2F4 TaxID=2607790 RepID=UPI00142A8310|nr:hypothetical protein [Okeania sp. SIO2F4]NES08279.1 hypothetical protein [Okeania sp. SIO2F4]
MIISQLNYLETANEEVLGGGGVKFDSYFKKDVYVTEKFNTVVKNDIYSQVHIYGNAAEAQAIANAYGKNTKTITDTSAQATDYSSESFSKSIAVVY